MCVCVCVCTLRHEKHVHAALISAKLILEADKSVLNIYINIYIYIYIYIKCMYAHTAPPSLPSLQAAYAITVGDLGEPWT